MLKSVSSFALCFGAKIISSVLSWLNISKFELPHFGSPLSPHFCFNLPFPFLHLPQSGDILIPCPLSYPFSQLPRLFSASNSLSAYFCTHTTPFAIFISSVCYQLHSRLIYIYI
jgi:hypothetical protein